MKVYLAGPMRGIPDYNFPQFHSCAHALRNIRIDVFSPAEKGCEKELEGKPEVQADLDFRRRVFLLDTEYICKEADAVVVLPGWEKSLGAQAEVALARAIGLEVYTIQEMFDIADAPKTTGL